MKIQLFLNKNLALHFYYHQDDFKKNRVKIKNLFLVAAGLPGLIYKDFFNERIKKNHAFFVVYYYGSWFSGGKFIFRNCQKTIIEAIKFIQKGKGLKTYDRKVMQWDYQNLFLVGNSFAGSPILSSEIKKDDVKKIILISPLSFIFKRDVLDFCSALEFRKMIKKYKKTLDFLRRGQFNVFRGINSRTWDDYFYGLDRRAKIKINKNFPPIIIFHGDRDKVVKSFFSKKLEEKYPQTVKTRIVHGVDHDFERLFNKFRI